jgi:putative FmdB family regulatory protein
MPTYEYECEACGHRFERFQQMSARPIRKCPECSGKVRRLIGTGGAIIFKGSGFYATDYHNSGPSCGRERPCCGRDTPCDTRPCDS